MFLSDRLSLLVGHNNIFYRTGCNALFIDTRVQERFAESQTFDNFNLDWDLEMSGIGRLSEFNGTLSVGRCYSKMSVVLPRILNLYIATRPPRDQDV